MPVFETLSDQMCRNTAVAVEALADAGNLGLVTVTHGQSVETPTESVFSNPALLATGGSNPHSGLAAAVVNQQSPLGFEFGDVLVGDFTGLEGVNDDQIVFAQNQFWSNPEQRCCGTNDGCCSNIDSEVAGVRGVEDGLRQEQAIESQCHCAPDQISLRSVHHKVLHLSIIAGTPADGKGK